MAERPLLAVEALRAGYAHAEVLHGLDLRLEAGEVLFLLGPNGAGKSTLLRCLAGRVPAEGRALLAGEDLLPLSTGERIRRGVVLCPEGRRLFPEMTVEDNLRLGAHLRRLEDVLRRIPLGRLGTPQDIVGAAVYLASPASDMVTGHALIVDGGWTAV